MGDLLGKILFCEILRPFAIKAMINEAAQAKETKRLVESAMLEYFVMAPTVSVPFNVCMMVGRMWERLSEMFARAFLPFIIYPSLIFGYLSKAFPIPVLPDVDIAMFMFIFLLGYLAGHMFPLMQWLRRRARRNPEGTAGKAGPDGDDRPNGGSDDNDAHVPVGGGNGPKKQKKPDPVPCPGTERSRKRTRSEFGENNKKAEKPCNADKDTDKPTEEPKTRGPTPLSDAQWLEFLKNTTVAEVLAFEEDASSTQAAHPTPAKAAPASAAFVKIRQNIEAAAKEVEKPRLDAISMLPNGSTTSAYPPAPVQPTSTPRYNKYDALFAQNRKDQAAALLDCQNALTSVMAMGDIILRNGTETITSAQPASSAQPAPSTPAAPNDTSAETNKSSEEATAKMAAVSLDDFPQKQETTNAPPANPETSFPTSFAVPDSPSPSTADTPPSPTPTEDPDFNPHPFTKENYVHHPSSQTFGYLDGGRFSKANYEHQASTHSFEIHR